MEVLALTTPPPPEFEETAPAVQHIRCISRPALDISRYREHLGSLELPEDQEAELLRTLWEIMAAFVDLGFNVDSVQYLIPALSEISLASPQDALEDVTVDAPSTTERNEERKDESS
jgi:hypothetical protein